MQRQRDQKTGARRQCRRFQRNESRHSARPQSSRGHLERVFVYVYVFDGRVELREEERKREQQEKDNTRREKPQREKSLNDVETV